MSRVFYPKAAANRWLFVLTLLGLAFVSPLENRSFGERGTVAEPARAQDTCTALDRYVSAPDTNYSFHLVKALPEKGYTTFILEMTSQAWLTTNEVDRPLWKHWVNIVRPETVTSSKSLLFITGGANEQQRFGTRHGFGTDDDPVFPE